MNASPDEAREFAAAFRGFLEWVHQDGQGDRTNEVVRLVRDHLGSVGLARSVVTKQLPAFEQVNLQVALNAWSARAGRRVEIHGVTVPPHWSGLSLQQLMTGDGLPPVRVSAPVLVDLPSGPGRTLACLQTALLCVEDDLGRYVVMVRGPEEHQDPSLNVEIAGLEVADAQALQADLTRLRSELNVYRAQVVEVSAGPGGGIQLLFADLPRTRREDVVLPEDVFRRVERHTVDVATHRAALRGAGQHLKRGVLLYGPPGTGKTHTTRYVVGRMTGCTVLLLSGPALNAIGAVAGLARELQPSVLVLEDVDLVAEDRGFHHGSSPVLFQLLDVMDGAAADADLLFLLTTNRADLLEPALAARPGRVDVAVEIALPDAAARRRLFELYGQGVPLDLSDEDVDQVVARSDGTTASFLKELLRRAVLESLEEASPLETVTGAHVSRALDDLLDSSQRVTRALLGVGGGAGDDDVPGPVPADGGRGGHIVGIRRGGPMPGVYYGGSYSPLT